MVKNLTPCPNAGICAAFCYAKSGTFMFKNVRKAHREKLELVLFEPLKWIDMMNQSSPNLSIMESI